MITLNKKTWPEYGILGRKSKKKKKIVEFMRWCIDLLVTTSAFII